ncbi:MAG: hypothetical protein E7Z90_05730 [Cyanobacteria bacterium SIG29]|nr:hypothetical protein [Cyanobacteria bacterium SIG29]
MKTILCFGDSNTFGYCPVDGSRYPENKRWTGLLKSKFNVLEEGLNNRVAFLKSPFGKNYSAIECFSSILDKYSNIDYIVIWIGTNDYQSIYNIDEKTINDCLKNLIFLAKQKADKVLIISPLKLDDNILNGSFSSMFNKNSIEKSNMMFPLYEQIALENNCLFLDINKIVKPSKIDGLHYDLNSHYIIFENIDRILSDSLEF